MICIFLLAASTLFTSCRKNNTDPSLRIEANITVDGLSRHYIVYLPEGYYEDTTAAYSLVIGMHGGGGSADQFDRSYGLTQKANAAKFIVAYPDGVRGDGPLGVRTWNAGTCCQYAVEHNINDVKFLSQMIDQLVGKYRIDAKKVYACGMSNGGMMAYRLACEIPGKIAAIAPVSCTMVYPQAFTPSRPVPIIHMQSAVDEKVPPGGGTGIGGIQFPPVMDGINTWVSKNNCINPPVTTEFGMYTLTKWPTCNAGVAIEYYLTKDGGHSWPGGQKGSPWADSPSTAINANDLMWAFFQRYSL